MLNRSPKLPEQSFAMSNILQSQLARQGGGGGPRMDSRAIQQLFVRYKVLALLLAVALIWIFFYFQTNGTFLKPNSISDRKSVV